MEQQRDKTNVPPRGKAAATGSGEDDGEIGRGVPSRLGIRDFREIFGATRREGEKRKARTRKGKQPEVVRHWNGLEDGEIQNGVPLLGLHVFKKVFETRRLEEEKRKMGATKGKDKQPEHEFFTGCDELEAQIGNPGIAPPKLADLGARVPNGGAPGPVQDSEPQTKTTNTLTGEPVKEVDGPPARVTHVLESPQENATSESSTIPVKIPLNKLERVRHMEFKSSIRLKAREVTLSGYELEKLRTFSMFVGTPNQQTLFKRQLPQCHRYAVELQREGSEPHTYICIEGLKKEEDIRHFYAVMSQRKYRRYYEPWKLCFRMAEVPYCAAPGTPPASGETDAPSCRCQIHIDSSDITLCGSVVRIKTKEGERIATIGGLIQAGGDTFALTTGHTSSAQDRLSDDHATPTSGASTANTLQDLDLPDDVESILIIDDPKIEGAEKMTVNWTSESPLVVETESIHEGEDWCLIPIPEQSRLPNLCNIPDVRVVTGLCSVDEPGGQLVHATGGVSGPVAGYVSAAPSFLDGLNGPIQVRAVNLHGGKGISVGDSGSWFVTQSSAQVLGPVIAMCDGTGKALITMLSDQFASISRSFPFDDYPSLAPSQTLLLRAAKRLYSKAQVGRAEVLVHAFLHTIATLSSFQHSDLTQTLKLAGEEFGGDFNQALKWLIMKAGTDIEPLIISSDPGNGRTEYSLNTIENLVLLRLCQIYHRREWLVAEDSVPSNIWSAARKAPNRVAPSTLLSSTLVGDAEGRSTVAPTDLEHNIQQPPRDYLGEDRVDNRVEAVRNRATFWRRDRLRRRIGLKDLYIILGLCYLAGLGVGAWQLITVNGVLDLGGKIGTGVAIIFVNLFLITVVYMLKTSR